MSRLIDFRGITRLAVLVVLLAMVLGALTRADAESTSVFLDPLSQTVGAVGDFFTVNVSITNVSYLYGYEFKLYYDSTVMNGSAQPVEGSFLKSAGGQTFFYVPSFTDSYNSTYGVVWVDDTLTGSVPGISGGGVLATLQFKSLATVNSSSMRLADVILLDSNVTQMSAQNYDGTVTVVPEFTSFLAVLTVFSVSSVGLLIRRRAKRQPEVSSK